MARYTLTYGRVIVLTTTIEADSENEALEKAFKLEAEGKLGLTPVPGTDAWIAEDNSEIDNIEDYEDLWEVARA